LAASLIAKATPSSGEDFKIGFWDEDLTTIDQLIDGDNIDNVLAERDPELRIGEVVESAFNRTVGQLLEYVENVVIVDPYAGSALAGSNAKRYWLFRRFLNQQISRIHVYTSVPEGKGFDALEGLERLKRNVKKMLRELPAFEGKITFHVYEANSYKFHHRRLALGIGDKKVCLMLEKGTDTFGSPEIEELTKLASISYKGFKEHLEGIRNSLVRQEMFDVSAHS
jgi:hypothetical protein